MWKSEILWYGLLHGPVLLLASGLGNPGGGGEGGGHHCGLLIVVAGVVDGWAAMKIGGNPSPDKGPSDDRCCHPVLGGDGGKKTDGHEIGCTRKENKPRFG